MNGEEEKTALEMAVIRLYRYSASEQPSAALDACLLGAARRRARMQRWLTPRMAIAASLAVVAISTAVMAGYSMVGRDPLVVGRDPLPPHASVLGPWQPLPLQAQFEGTSSWPLARDRKLLTMARYELPGAFDDSLLDAGLADDGSGHIDLKDFATRARDGLGGRP